MNNVNPYLLSLQSGHLAGAVVASTPILDSVGQPFVNFDLLMTLEKLLTYSASAIVFHVTGLATSRFLCRSRHRRRACGKE